jgi:muramoyltetrapeptide carboxypeptidase LdcA involved in peptidoglycan recycling
MSHLTKPRALQRGDEVAVITPSWTGPNEYPHVFDAGVATLTGELGLRVREYPTTRAPAPLDPKQRARDLMAAVADPNIAGIVAAVGGDDTVRMLPYLDLDLVARNPKVLLGYSDVTTLLLAWLKAGVVPLHGPTVMAGLAQAPSFPLAFLEQLRAVVFDGDAHPYEQFPWWVQSYPDWADPVNATAVGTKYARAPLRAVQGSGVVTAPVIGGCFDVLAMLLGTAVFPTADELDGKFLLLETSEEIPLPRQILRFLWNLEAQGTLERLAGVLMGRLRGYRPDQRAGLEKQLVELLPEDMPIMTGLDVGHTDPQIVLPLGVPVRVDLDNPAIALGEPAVS